jgi:uncharacterized protein YkwD
MACANGQSYMIQTNDSLFSIAQATLGDGNRFHEIVHPDGSPFTDDQARQLQVGQEVCIPNQRTHTNPSDVTNRVVALVNQKRKGFGLPPLSRDQRLDASSQAHTEIMATHEDLSHQYPQERALGDRIRAVGYQWKGVGENIAAGYATPEAAVDGWFNEPPGQDGHRRNILGDFKNIGVGFVNAPGTKFVLYWTTDFGNPA